MVVDLILVIGPCVRKRRRSISALEKKDIQRYIYLLRRSSWIALRGRRSYLLDRVRGSSPGTIFLHETTHGRFGLLQREARTSTPNPQHRLCRVPTFQPCRRFFQTRILLGAVRCRPHLLKKGLRENRAYVVYNQGRRGGPSLMKGVEGKKSE